jgi:hypothetical protein
MAKQAPQTGRTNYIDEYACYCHIIAAVIFRAYQDAMGTVESTGDILRRKEEIMKDGAAYFEDGRFAHHAELIGLDPTLRPDWSKDK